MYMNESTNEIVKKDATREGIPKIEKHIAGSPVCQDGKVSSDRMVIMSDDLSSSVVVELNYTGEEDALDRAGKALTDAPFGVC